jgi:hypothetical protein
MRSRPVGWPGVATLLACVACPGTATAQAPAPTSGPPASPPRWTLAFDANAFVGWNYQRRHFTDFQEVESQNWVMGSASRPLGRATLTLVSMLSLEAFTIQDLGSPQVFQTGETFEGAPLIDYQHPHDLFMGLGASFARQFGAVRARADVSLVGEPAVGPPVFMHRPSAQDNPQVPLSHHNMDSTHITHGVLKGGIEWKVWQFEASAFHGREPDEQRLDLDLGAIDSWSVRASWASGPWSAQVSGAHLTEPEVAHFGDVTRITASAGYTGVIGDRQVALLAAWGQNREAFATFDAYLLEGRLGLTDRDGLYSRAEYVAKNILGGAFHPPGFEHPHPTSRIGALTGGYVRDLRVTPIGRFGVGGDVTIYRVPENLVFYYGRPLSFHVFMRYRPNRTAAADPHAHH